MLSKKYSRRYALHMAAGMALGSHGSARSATYPDRPLRLVIGFPPGGPVDIAGRLVGEILSSALKQPVVVDNKPGAGGAIGLDAVAKAAPDGLTLGIGPVSCMAIMPAGGVKLPYQVERDFTMISMLATLGGAILVHPDAPFSDLAGLLAYARANPGQLAFGSSGVGTSSHLAGELLAYRAGVEMVHVPYRGTAPAVQDLLGGQIKVLFETSITSAVQLVKAGRVKAVALTGSTPSPLLPQVKTVAEQGYPGYDVAPWMGLVAPAGLAQTRVDLLQRTVAAGLATAQAQSRLATIGGVAKTSSPEEFRRFVASDTQQWAALIKSNHITIQ